jgi:hypothetical protein
MEAGAIRPPFSFCDTERKLFVGYRGHYGAAHARNGAGTDDTSGRAAHRTDGHL